MRNDESREHFYSGAADGSRLGRRCSVFVERIGLSSSGRSAFVRITGVA